MKRIISKCKCYIVGLMVIVLFVACGKSVQATWQEQYDLGVRYLSEGNYQEAVIAFTAAIEIDPKRFEAYSGAAEAYVAMEDIETALAILTQGYEETGEESLQSEQEQLREKQETDIQEEQQEVGEEIEAEEDVTVENLMPALEQLNSFIADQDGVEVDVESNWYSPVYSSYDAYMNDERPIAVQEWTDRFSPYVYTYSSTPWVSDLSGWQVQNFNSLQEWQNYMLQYMMPDIAAQFYEKGIHTLFEIDGKLYRFWGNRGYGMFSLHLDTVEIQYESSDTCTVKVDRYFFDSKDGVSYVELVREDGVWKISDYYEEEM